MGRDRHASETVRLEDMRLFAAVADARSMSGAARRLDMPKQTVSRRIAQLEDDLGVPLMHRTTRTLHFTEAGAAYAERCREIVRIADDANRAVTEVDDEPRGTLRVTADPVFGDAFVGDLVIEYARRWPRVAIDLVMTRRRVDLVEPVPVGPSPAVAASSIKGSRPRGRACHRVVTPYSASLR